MAWKCIPNCGACCISIVPGCKHYNVSYRKCNAYAERPTLCNSKEASKLLGIPLEDSAKYCRIVIKRTYGEDSKVMKRFNRINKG